MQLVLRTSLSRTGSVLPGARRTPSLFATRTQSTITSAAAAGGAKKAGRPKKAAAADSEAAPPAAAPAAAGEEAPKKKRGRPAKPRATKAAKGGPAGCDWHGQGSRGQCSEALGQRRHRICTGPV
jgi:uncharacterized membrane protein